MKRFITIVCLLLLPFTASAQLTTQQGGTGSTSPSGILYGITGNLHLQTVSIGSGLQFLAGVLSASGGGSSSFSTTSLSAVAPLQYSQSPLAQFSITQSGTGTNGYLSSTDFNTFNNKISSTSLSVTTTGTSGAATYTPSTGVFNIPQYQAGGNYITALTGDVTASGPGSTAATLATVNGNVGTFTYATITVNAKGLITSASNGTTPEVPLTFTTPLTRAGNTISFSGITTSSPISAGASVLYATGVNTVASVATSTLTPSAPLTGSFVHIGTTGSLGITQSGISTDGYLSSVDWNLFNNKVSSSSLSQIFPFTPTTNFGTNVNSTSTPIWFTLGLQASSTIQAANISIDQYSSYMQNGTTTLYATTTVTSAELGTLIVGPNACPSCQLLSNPGRNAHTAIGVNALSSLNTGVSAFDTAVGYSALQNMTAGSQNTAIGARALSNFTGSSPSVGANTVLGYSAGLLLTGSALRNTFLGSLAGASEQQGIGNIAIGAGVDVPLINANQQLSIGNLIYGTGIYSGTSTSSAPILGSLAGIGTTTPYAKLSVHANNGDTALTVFAIGSSTATATTTLFAVSNTGTTTIANGVSISAGCFFYNGACLTQGGAGTVTSITAGLGLNGGTITNTGTIDLKSYVATSSGETQGFLPYWTSTNGTPATLGKVATTSLTASGVLTLSNPISVIGASASALTLTGGTNGQILGWLSGVPTWTASSSVAAGTGISVSASGAVSTVTNTGVISLTNGTGINCSGTNPGSCSFATINAGVLGAVVNGNSPTSQSTSTLYGVAPAGGYVLGWNNNTSGIAWIATSSSATVTSDEKWATSTLPTSGIYPNSAVYLGLGTTTPRFPLQIATTTVPQLVLTDPLAATNQKHWYLQSVSGSLLLGTTSDSFATTSLAAITISPNSTTTVGIATTSPFGTLGVNGTISWTGYTASAGTVLGVCYITATGLLSVNSAASCVTSSIRFKDNVKDLTVGIDDLMKLRPVSFTYKDSHKPEIGLVAEEVQSILPTAVGLDEQGLPSSLDTQQLLALTIKSVQDQQKEIDSLKTFSVAVQDDWQWFAIVLLTVGMFFQYRRIKRLEIHAGL